MWIISNDELKNTLFSELPEKSMVKPYPSSLWRTDLTHNSGYPYHNLLPGIEEIHVDVVYQPEYITVFDIQTIQTDFETNGLAILTPTVCNVTEELNGMWSADIEHPIDEEGKWQYITEWNHIKILGQIFTIKRADHTYTGGSGRVEAYAEHIFYQMQDAWCFPESIITATDGDTFISSTMQNATYFTDAESTVYEFSHSSDVEVNAEVISGKYQPIPAACTPVELLLGADGLTANFGGQLYRDNFYFSINNHMENAKENAFDIRVGLNLKGIKRVVDVSTLCTYFRAYDNYGGWFAVGYDSRSLPRAYPHHIVRSQSFSYDEWNMAALEADCMRFFKENCTPLISITVTLADVKDNPDFKELLEMPEYKVGNTGRVYDVRLGITLTLQITKTVTDGITGRVVEVTFGNLRSFAGSRHYIPPALGGSTITPQGGAYQLHDSNRAGLRDRNGMKLMRRVQ